jgi:hypothetical protein
MPHFEITFGGSALILILLVLLGALLAAVFYRYTVPPVARRRRILLSLLRAGSLCLMVLLLFEPFFKVISSTTDPPTLAVLIDNSESMRIDDPNQARADILQSVLASEALQRLSENAKLRYYTFGTTLLPTRWAVHDTLPLDEKGTDIARALNALNQEREDVQAVLLVSDGVFTVGKNPVHAATQLARPIFTVGIGDTAEQRDVLVSRVAANDLVYAGTPTPVDVTLRSSGFPNQRVEVSLRSGGKLLDRKTVTFGEGARDYSVSLSYTPEGEGTQKYRVAVSWLEGELTGKNNARSFYAKVLRSKLRLLIIAGAPSPDLSAIRQTFIEDENTSVRSFTERQPAGWYEGNLDPSLLDSADCYVLVGFPTSATPDATIEQLSGAIQRNSSPYLLVASPRLDHDRLASISRSIPYTVELSSPVERLAYFQPADAHQSHYLLSLGTLEGFSVWRKLPPLFATLTVYRPKPGTLILGHSRTSSGSPDPFLLLRTVGGQKSLAILGHGIWRWRLMGQGNPQTASFLSRFLTSSIQWLASREESRRVRVKPVKPFFHEGEPVAFLAQVYNAASHPIDRAQITVSVQHDDEVREVALKPIGNGRYDGELRSLRMGDYSYSASAEVDGIPVGRDSGRFSVGETNLEFLETPTNRQLLRELAHLTGGGYIAPAEIDSLAPALLKLPGFAPRESTSVRSLALWGWPYTLALLLLLLALEWFLRKRSGML